MTIYRCAICSYEFDEDKEKKKKFTELQKCPSCSAKKEKMKPAKDFLEEAIKGLQKYREGTPKGELETCD